LFSVIGIMTILYVFYRIMMEIRDNYENKNEDPYTLALIEKIRYIDTSVDEIVDNLRFFEGDKSYTIDKKYVFLCKYDKKTGEQYHNNQLIFLHLLNKLAKTPFVFCFSFYFFIVFVVVN
jgi:hypothetical protein